MGYSKSKKINPILDTLKELLKKEGFKKKSTHWCYRNDETILMVNLQKSWYGEQYYINLGVWIKVLADEKYIKKYFISDPNFPTTGSHITLRLEAAALTHDSREEARKLLVKVCDLENNEYSFEEKKKIITDMMVGFGLVLLRECSTLDGTIKAYKEDRLKGAGIYVSFQELMNKDKIK